MVTVGLTFDSKAIYAAEAGLVFGKPVLRRWTVSDIAPVSEEVSKEKTFEKAFLETVEKARLRKKRVVLSVPGNESIIRYFEIPLIPRREWATVVRFEAQKYVPFEIRDLNFNFQVFSEPKKKILRVVFTAVRRNFADFLAKLFKEAGLDIPILEPDAFSVSRLHWLEFPKKTNEVHALVTVGSDRNLNMVLIKNRIILMTRTTVVAAEGTDLPQGRFEPFAKEVALSYSYFTKTFKSEEIRRIRLSAETGYDTNEWVKALNSRFEIRSENWDLSKIKHAVPGPGFLASFGASLRSRPLLPFLERGILNLSSKSIEGPAVSWSEQKKVLIHQAFQGALFAVACVLAAHLVFLWRIGSVRKEVELLKKNFQRISSEEADLSQEQLVTIKGSWDTKVCFAFTLTTSRIFWTEKLSRIALVVPEEIWIMNLEASDTTAPSGASAVTLRVEGYAGQASDGETLGGPAKFVNLLLSDGVFMKGFDSVVLSRVGKSPGNSTLESLTTFAIDCASKR